MYKPIDSSQSPRFVGNRTFMRLEQVRTTDDIDFAVLGVPFRYGSIQPDRPAVRPPAYP